MITEYQRTQHVPDDFGNAIRICDYITAEERDNPPAGSYGIVDRWEVSTSTYGGDSVTDCNEI